MLFFLRWLDGEENAADTRTSSAPLPSLSPMEVSNLERHRELAVQSKGPSQEVTGSDLDYFGKMVPGRGTIMFDTTTHRQIISMLLMHAKSFSRALT